MTIVDIWLVYLPWYDIRSTLAMCAHGLAVLNHGERPSAMPCGPLGEASHEAMHGHARGASLALERLLPRACRLSGVIADA